MMSTLTEIQRAVEQLSPEELTRFRGWFADFDAQSWDRQLEQDMAADRLDALGSDALEEQG